MTPETTEAIRSIIFNARRCGSPSTAFLLISQELEEHVTVANWRQLTEEKGQRALKKLEGSFPARPTAVL